MHNQRICHLDLVLWLTVGWQLTTRSNDSLLIHIVSIISKKKGPLCTTMCPIMSCACGVIPSSCHVLVVLCPIMSCVCSAVSSCHVTVLCAWSAMCLLMSCACGVLSHHSMCMWWYVPYCHVLVVLYISSCHVSAVLCIPPCHVLVVCIIMSCTCSAMCLLMSCACSAMCPIMSSACGAVSHYVMWF